MQKKKKTRSLTTYLKYRDEMKSGDLLLFSPDSYLGGVIEWRTGYDITHIGFLFRHEFIDNHVLSLEALENGICFNRLSRRISNYEGQIYWLPLKEDYDCYRNDLSKIAFLCSFSKFPIGTLVSNFISPTIVDYQKMLCSEYCYYPYMLNNMVVWRRKMPYPGEFEKLDIFKNRVLITNDD